MAARLTREGVVDMAVEIADREGLDALTIRRLAKDLGVTAMALYWHVADKEQLLAALRERMLSEIELPPPIAAWEEELRELLAASLRAFARHPALAPLALAGIVDSEPGLMLTERTFSVLGRAGFSPQQTAHLGAYLLSSLVTLVSAQPGADLPPDPGERARLLAEKHAWLATIPRDRFPTVANTFETMLLRDPETNFDQGVDVLVLGLRGLAQRDAGR